MAEKLPLNEIQIKCSIYSKCLKNCPSSKKILSVEDFELLKSNCLTKEHTKCKFYKEAIEKAA